MTPKQPSKQRTLKTASGMSINELALQLKRQNPNIKLKDHLTKARSMIEAGDTIKYGGGSKLRYKMIRGALGKRAAGYLTDTLADKGKMQEAHGHLADFEASMSMAEKERSGSGNAGPSMAALKAIMGKLDKIEKAVMAIKTPRATEVKTLATPMATKHDDQAEKDLASGIKGLFPNFGKDDIKALIASVSHLETEEAKLLAIIKAQGKVEKIPKPHVADEVKKAQMAHAAAPVPSAPVAPTSGTNQPKAEHQQVPPQPLVSPVMTSPPALATPSPANSASTDADQKEAEEVKKLQDEERARKAQEEREEAMKAELDKIYKKLETSSFADLLTDALLFLGKGLIKSIGKALGWLIKKGAMALAELGKNVWKGIKGIASSLKSLFKAGGKAGEKAGAEAAAGAGEKLIAKEAEKVGSEEVAKVASKSLAKSFLKKIPVIGALAGLGFAAADLFEGDVVGAGLDAASGIAAIIPGIGTAASLAIDGVHAAHDMGAFSSSDKTKEVPKSATAAAALGAQDTMPKDEWDDDAPAAAPVIVKNDNRKTIVQGGDMTPLIKVRNDEPTAGGLAGSMFDHPLAYNGIYRM